MISKTLRGIVLTLAGVLLFVCTIAECQEIPRPGDDAQRHYTALQ
jgi:hypothetical protein